MEQDKYIDLRDSYIFKERLYSHMLELRIIFVSRFENLTFDHYLTKPKLMI